MILQSKACCDDCAGNKSPGMGSFWDYVNPVTAAKKIATSVVDTVGAVAQDVVTQSDKVTDTILSTTLKTGAAAHQLLQPQGDGSAAVTPVSYTPLIVGGLAAAGLVLWAIMPPKKKEPA